MRTMTIVFIICSFLIGALSIGAMIVNSDLQQAIDFTSCNTVNIINETYVGNDNASIPWSGVNNFQVGIDQFAINIQNVVPQLDFYFSSSNNLFL